MSTPLAMELLSDAIVAPLTYLTWGQNGQPGTFDGGAYYADGAVCARSLHRKTGFVNEPGALPPGGKLPRLAGTHFYAGMLKNEHFGHFLVESISRFWALRPAILKLKSIVFYARMHRQPVPSWALELIALLAPDIPVTVVSDPTIFETLIVPDQVADPQNANLFGHALVREAFGGFREIEGKQFPKLYVSRSKLPNSGNFLGESSLEGLLTKEGYQVIHPEEHTVREQVSFYNGAQTIIFAEGAAIHLFALVCRPVQKVFIVQRRKHAHVFDRQLRSFGLTPVIGPESPAFYLVPERHSDNTLYARARLDFSKLRDHLCAAGFISGHEWQVPSEAVIEVEIKCIEARIGQKLVEYSASRMNK